MSDDATVLVVDDDNELVELYATWLADEYAVRSATDGEAALSLLDADVDVVLLDRRMPGLDGGTVLERIRDRGLDCRVAMVTGVTPDVDIVEMGFDEYVRKPVDREALLGVVGRLLDRSAYDEQMRELYALASKRATLLAEHDDAEAPGDPHPDLAERIDEVRGRIDDTVDEFDVDDFQVVFRDVGEEEEQ